MHSHTPDYAYSPVEIRKLSKTYYIKNKAERTSIKMNAKKKLLFALAVIFILNLSAIALSALVPDF